MQQPKSAAELEKEQEALLMAKFGGMKPKPKLIPKDHKYFDSADWALAKESHKQEAQAQVAELPVKLEPTGPSQRRVTALQHEDKPQE